MTAVLPDGAVRANGGTPASTRAVVTGLSVVAPNGGDTEAYWAATLAGRTGIAPISRYDASSYPVTLAGEVLDLDPAESLSSRLLPQTDRVTRFALVASDRALADASLDPAGVDEFGMGVVTASGSGGFEFAQNELQNLWSKGPEYVSAYQSFAWFYAVNTGQISIRHGMRGPSGVLVSDQAGSLDALGHARRHVRNGTEVVLSGGMDASLSPWGLVSQLPTGRLSTATDPTAAYLPFDVRARGAVPGEGGAIMVVESAASAARRGAPRIWGEIAGYGATFDPAPGSGRPAGLQRAAEIALADSGLADHEIDVVFADAAGLPGPDAVEAEAITALFGPRGVPVTAPKVLTGRLYSGAGAVDVAAALLAIRDGVLPPTPGVAPSGAGAELDIVTEPRAAAVTAALVLARGHGGFNSAVVVRAPR